MTTTYEPTILPPRAVRSRAVPTIWGLDPRALHDHYWASYGVQVVRAGQSDQITHTAELFLLIDPQVLVVFDLTAWLEVLSWTKPDILLLRLQSKQDLGYREVFSATEDGDFLAFRRQYETTRVVATRAALTCELELAKAWQASENAWAGWRQIRAAIPRTYRETRTSPGRVYRASDGAESAKIVEDLASIWAHPGTTVSRPHRRSAGIWIDPTAQIDKNTQMIAPVWVGAGRHLTGENVVVGPAVLWDDPAQRPEAERIRWADIEPNKDVNRLVRNRKKPSWTLAGKRIFDLIFAFLALILTLPLYPFIMLAILLEDGRPFFFRHHRETTRGRTFRCIKFRSMRKDADEIKAQLAHQNQADGPQFFIEEDPRLTRVGRVIRKTFIDELPQFINVLLGDMSVVGPRPSPHKENQFCAEWREARLSVRPGITGLWQVRRTRLPGQDFQEWIKYDIEYVDTMSVFLDLKIIWRTITVMVRRMVRS